MQPPLAGDDTPRTLEVETEENKEDLRKRKSSVSKSGKALQLKGQLSSMTQQHAGSKLVNEKGVMAS